MTRRSEREAVGALRIAIAVVFATAVSLGTGACAERRAPDSGAGGAPAAGAVSSAGTVRTCGPLRVDLRSVTRSNGVLSVVVVTTNSSDSTQPVHFDMNHPWLTDAAGKAVRPADSGSAGVRAMGVTGGGLSLLGEMIGADGRVTTTASFVDPGAGATLHYAPGPSRVSSATATWRLDEWRGSAASL
jgi:hypothetical protein